MSLEGHNKKSAPAYVASKASLMSERRQVRRNRRYSEFWGQRKNQWLAACLTVGIAVVAAMGIAFLILNGLTHRTIYTGDKLLRVFPKTERDRAFLQKFESLHIDAHVLGLPVNHKVPVYMYVKSGSMYQVEKNLSARNLTFNILIQNMQQLIDREYRTVAERRAQYTSQEFDFGNYQPFEAIVEWLFKLSNSSEQVNVVSMGKTHEERDLLLVEITKNESTKFHHQHEKRAIEEAFGFDATVTDSILPENMNISEEYDSQAKPVIYINCGVHAKEWVAISSCLWMINELTNSSSPIRSSHLLDTFDFWFVPVANPDGYVYSWTTDRLWQKNRSPHFRCYGVDLNRNYDVSFNTTSRNSCSSSFGGSEPNSEEETQTVVKLLSANRHRVKAALFIHSFSQLWLSPYGVNNTYPKEYPEMERVMSMGVAALKSKFGTEYQFGSFANVMYSSSGTAIDYCYEKLGIVYSYIVDLRDRGSNSFMLPIEEIQPTAMETWDGIIAMIEAIMEKMD